MLSNEGINNEEPRQESDKLTGEKEADSRGKTRKSNNIPRMPIRGQALATTLNKKKQARGNRAWPKNPGRGGRKGY
jgi:hypothetical protein